jgi:hypothetical protein
MTIQIPPIAPVDQEPVYEFVIALGDATFRVETRWNTRTEAWYMSLWDSNEVKLFSGIKMVPNYELLWRYQGDEYPDGILILFDWSNSGLYAEYDDFGHDFEFRFYPPENIIVVADDEVEHTIVEIP